MNEEISRKNVPCPNGSQESDLRSSNSEDGRDDLGSDREVGKVYLKEIKYSKFTKEIQFEIRR